MKIKLAGNFFENFTDFSYEQSLDSLASVFSLACKYDETNRNLFRPLSYMKVEFYDENEKLFFTGTALSHDFDSDSEPNSVQISGYSLPGILEDCTLPNGYQSLESNKTSLQGVIAKLIKPFNLQLVIEDSAKNEANKNYSKTVIGPDETIKGYLSKLTSQKNLILSHDEKGRVLLMLPNAHAAPSYVFNKENAVSMNLSIDGQNMHSQITNLRQPKAKKEKKKKKDAEVGENEFGFPLDYKFEDTPENPKPPKPKQPKEKPVYFDTHKNPLISVFRPITNILSEGEDFDTKAASKAQFADELKSIKLTISLNEFVNLKPGQIIQVKNDEIYLNELTNFMIWSISKNENEKGREMIITAVIPEAFTGETPKKIFA
jgi:prophage tail gpP-like protein